MPSPSQYVPKAPSCKRLRGWQFIQQESSRVIFAGGDGPELRWPGTGHLVLEQPALDVAPCQSSIVGHMNARGIAVGIEVAFSRHGVDVQFIVCAIIATGNSSKPFNTGRPVIDVPLSTIFDCNGILAHHIDLRLKQKDLLCTVF